MLGKVEVVVSKTRFVERLSRQQLGMRNVEISVRGRRRREEEVGEVEKGRRRIWRTVQ